VKRSTNIYKTIDWPTVIVYFILVLFGWINIYAAVYNEEHRSIWDLSQRYGKQLLWISISIILVIIIFLFDGRMFEYLSYPIYFIAIITLLGVLLFGEKVNQSRSWFEIGNFRIQPAEFAKVATALVVARVMSIYDFKIGRSLNDAEFEVNSVTGPLPSNFGNDSVILDNSGSFLILFRMPDGMSIFVMSTIL